MFLSTAIEERRIHAPIAEHFTVVPLPIFPLPRAMQSASEKTSEGGLSVTGIYVGHVAEPDKTLDAHHPAESMATIATIHASEFARLIAKIAHGVAVAQFGLDRIVNPVLPDVILGRDPDIGRWVGTISQDPFPVSLGVLHFAYTTLTDRGLLVAVQLFTWQPSPPYVAIVTESPLLD